MNIPDSDVARLVQILSSIEFHAREANVILDRAITEHDNNEDNENPGGTDRQT